MPDFEPGVYVLTSSHCHNNAALLNDNANEPVRGILHGPVGAAERDVEKVRPALSLEI